MTIGKGEDLGGAKQYVESDMCEQKHGEVLRQLGDLKEILMEIKGIVNPAVVKNTQAIETLKEQKKSGLALIFDVIGVVGLIVAIVVAIVALKG